MLTPQAVKKLIEKRNERFRQAVGGSVFASDLARTEMTSRTTG